MGPTPFSVHRLHDRLKVAGEVDLATVPILCGTLASYDGARLVVDLGAVTFLDVTGWRSLRTALARQPELRLGATSSAVDRLCVLCGPLDPTHV